MSYETGWTKRLDLLGSKFGELTVIKPLDSKVYISGRKRRQWEVLCSCGNKEKVTSSQLTSDKKTCCVSCSFEWRRKPLTGQKFGELEVISPVVGTEMWNCLCSCGKQTMVYGSNLYSKHTQSCGHLKMTSKYGAAFHNIFLKYRHSAKIRNHIFTLSEDFVYILINKPCHYCGTLPANKNRINKNYKISPSNCMLYSGIDRINSNLGYTEDNTVPSCWNCNRMKNDMNQNKFLEHIEKIHSFQKGNRK